MSNLQDENLNSIASLNDPVRKSLYDFIRSQAEPVGRDEAAEALDLPRSTAAFHLDRLVNAGLLSVEFKRLGNRTGPGSGRPSKLYQPMEAEISVSVPPRQYDLAGELLAAAITRSDAQNIPVKTALETVSREIGRTMGRDLKSLEQTLQDIGYEPQPSDNAEITMANCPFHKLSENHTEIICKANFELLRGIAETASADEQHTAVFAPGEGPCCVRLLRH